MNNLLQILLGLIIAALLVVFAAPYFIDWNHYKTEIENQASKIAGRELSISGDVHLRLLPAPYLQLEGIEIKAQDGATDSPVPFRAKAFRLWLAAPPLLRGAVEVEGIELQEPHIRLSIDENGRSNWHQEFKPTRKLPFTPKSISLQSMQIKKGSFELVTPALQDKRAVRIKDLNGDFSAGSLNGPFKFDGSVGDKTANRVLRFSTGRLDGKGDLRLKGLMRQKETGQRYSFDGSILQLKQKPNIVGVLSANLPLFELKTLAEQKEAVLNPIEVKASINANIDRAAFDQILVTLVHRNRPQMMTGKGEISWNKSGIDLNGALSARLLDLDHLKDGMNVGSSLSDSLTNLLGNLNTIAAKVDTGRFLIDVKQIKLNSDLVQDLLFDLEKEDGMLKVKNLRAKLPGNNKITMNGLIDGDEKTTQFRGNGMIRGHSLGGLVTWSAATRENNTPTAIRAHPFTIRGNLLFDPQMWTLDNVKGDIAATSFTGEISHRRATPSQRGEIRLDLTTSEINSTALMGRPVSMHEIIGELTGASQKQGTDKKDGEKSRLSNLVRNNIVRLKLRAGRLKLEDLDGRDLVADLYFGLKSLQILEFSLASPKGLLLQADGTIDQIETDPSGTLTGTVNITDDQELRQVISWFEDAKQSSFTPQQIKSLLPLRLAVMLQTASDKGADARIRVNGIAGQTHINLKNRILGANLFSRRAPARVDQLELSGTLSNKDGRILLSQLVPYLPDNPEQVSEIGDGRVWFSAAGLPHESLNSRIEFNSPKVTAGLDGLLSKKDGTINFHGTTHLEAKETAAGLALIGINTDQKSSYGELKLTSRLQKEGMRYVFTSINGALSKSDLQGRATLEISPEEKKIDLVLLTGSVDLPALLSPLLEKSPVAGTRRSRDNVRTAALLASEITQEIGDVASLQDTAFPQRRFLTDTLHNMSAKILITSDRLTLGAPFVVNKGEISATIKDRKVTIENIGGSLWKGNFSGKGELDLSSTIAKVHGDLLVRNAKLDQSPFTVDNGKLAAGELSLDLDFSGRGISPSGLVSLMNGKGNLRLTKGKINRFSSSVLEDIVEDELALWDKSEDQTPFKERFKRHLLHADYDISELKTPFSIKDGTLLMNAEYEKSNLSKLGIDANLTLSSMTSHSRLTISPLNGNKYANLPPVSVAYNGSLAQIASISPSIETNSLEQHLKVMKMEHDVDLLEKIHKRDEEFAQRAARRREEERKYQEEEKRRAEQESKAHSEPDPFETDQSENMLLQEGEPPAETSETPPKKHPAKPKNNPFDWIPFIQ